VTTSNKTSDSFWEGLKDAVNSLLGGAGGAVVVIAIVALVVLIIWKV
jgi:hypothetical protein